MPDIAALALEVNSDSLQQATVRLRELPKAAEQAGRSVEKLTSSTDVAAKSTDEFSRRVQRTLRDLQFEKDQLNRSAAEQARYTALKRAGVAELSAEGQAISNTIRSLQSERQARQQALEASRLAAEQERQAIQLTQQSAAGYAALARQRAADAAEANRQAQQRADVARKVVADLEFERAQLSRTSTERMQHDALRRAGVTAASAEGKAIMTTVAALEMERTALRQLAVARQEAARPVAAGMATGYMGTPGQTGLNAQQKVMLGYQLQDVFTSLAGGMNPAVVAAQQGPQISMLFGGFRNMLNAIPKPALAAGGVGLAGIAGTAALNSLAEMNDNLREQDRRFGTLMGSGTAAVGMYRDIAKVASSVAIGIDQATASVEGFAKATQGLGASRQNILDIASVAERLIKMSGANENEAGAGRQGLAEILKQSSVSADQLKAVLASVPQIAEQIAAGLGVSVTQLRLMTSEGDLTNRKVMDALLERSTAVNAEFERMPKSVGSLFSSIGTDLGVALKNLADSIPLVNQYRNALELAAKAAKALREARTPESSAAIVARTDGTIPGGVLDVSPETAAGRLSPDPLGTQRGGAVGNSTALVKKALEERAQALRNLHAQIRLEEKATADATRRAADEILLNATTVARKFDELGETYRNNRRDIDTMEKALDNLQAGLTNLSAEEAARQMDILRGSIQRAREEASNIDPALKAINDVNRRNGFRANDNSPAGMALQERVRELSGGDPAREQNAITAALAEQQEKVADIVVLKQQEADASKRMLDAVRKGKAATIEAKVEAAVLAFVWANVGNNVEVSADQIKAYGDSIRTILNNEEMMGGVNAAKQYTDELAAIAAAMGVVERGAYAMRRAEAEARASRDENGTGGLQMEVFDARQRLTDETMLSALREEIDLTNRLAEAAGDVAKQKALQLEFDIKRAQQNADPASAAKIAAEMEAKAIADTRREWIETTVELENQNVILEAQLRLMGQSPEIIAKEIALIKVRQDAERAGIAVTQEMIDRRMQVVETGERLKAQAEELRRAQELWTAPLKSALESIQQTGADAFETMLESGKFTFESLGQTFGRIVRRMAAEFLALATIRPVMSVLVNAVSPSMAQSMGLGGGMSFPGMGGGGMSMPSMGGGSMFGGGGLGNMFGFLNQPIMGADALNAATMTASLTGQPLGLGAQLGGMSWGQGLGAAAGAGMGVFQLMNSKSTADTIGGISSIVGAGVSLIPGFGQIAGPLIALAGNILPGLFGLGPSKPTITDQGYGQVSYGSNGFFTTGGAWGPNANAGSLQGPLGQVGQTMQGILQALGGVKDASRVWGVALESFSQQYGDDSSFSNQTSFLVGPNGQRRQWGMGSTPGDIGMEAAGVAATLESILGGAVGEISDNMRKALGEVNRSGKDTFQTLSTVVAEVMAFDEALKGLSASTSGVEQALAQIDAQFAGLYDTASKFGFATGGIDAAKQAERLKFATGFADSIQRGINDLTDPTINQLADLDKWRTEAIATNNDILKNVTGALDQINRIEELYALQRAQIVEDSAERSLSSLQDLVRSLQPGGALANVDPRGQLAGLESTYRATYAQASAGDPTALARFASDATAYAQFGQSFYAGSTDYNRIRDGIVRDTQGLMGGGMPNAANQGAAAMTANVQQLVTTMQQSHTSDAELKGLVTRMIGLLERFVANNRSAA